MLRVQYLLLKGDKLEAQEIITENESSQLVDAEKKAYLSYVKFITLEKEEYKSEALQLYKTLYKSIPKYLYKIRIDKLNHQSVD